jgi:hypothetical protein
MIFKIDLETYRSKILANLPDPETHQRDEHLIALDSSDEILIYDDNGSPLDRGTLAYRKLEANLGKLGRKQFWTFDFKNFVMHRDGYIILS